MDTANPPEPNEGSVESQPTKEPWPAHGGLGEIDGLEVLDLMDRGGHGSVYCARQADHDRLVALKVLDARLLDEAVRRRFDRERMALGRVSDHPGIVSLLGSGYTSTQHPYLVLEYASQGSLRTALNADGPLGLDAATELAITLAAALERAHHHGVIHRDIKPENVLRSGYGEWMLSDFGVAALIDRAGTSTLQVSYAHIAPETFMAAEPSAAGDVYSLASVLATALSGDEPFAVRDGEAAVAAMRRVAMEPYPDLRRAGVPDDLAALLEVALSKEPSQRPVSAYSFATALNEIRARHQLPKVPIRTGIEQIGSDTVEVMPDALVQDAASRTGASATVDDAPEESSTLSRLVVAAALIFGCVGAGVYAFDEFETVQDVPDAVQQLVVADVGPDDNDGQGRDGRGPGNGAN